MASDEVEEVVLIEKHQNDLMQTILALSLALFVPTDIVVQMFTCISWKNALEEFFLRCSHAICVSIGKETITHCRVKSHV